MLEGLGSLRLDLVVTAQSPYATSDAAQNGLNGRFAQISFAANSQVRQTRACGTICLQSSTTHAANSSALPISIPSVQVDLRVVPYRSCCSSSVNCGVCDRMGMLIQDSSACVDDPTYFDIYSCRDWVGSNCRYGYGAIATAIRIARLVAAW